MADLGMTFDASQVEPNSGPMTPIPTDWYNVMITDSEMKPTKDKSGGYLELTLKVMDGEHAGRQVWDRLNLYNQNPVAVEIAQKTLSAICHSVGVFQVQDSQVLHGKPLMARIVVREAQGGYDASNEVKGYAKVGERVSNNAAGVASAPAPAPAPAPTAPPAGGTAPNFSPPWNQAPTTTTSADVPKTNTDSTPPWMR